MEWMFAKTIMSLVAVLGLMVGIVVVMRKYVYKGQAPGSSVVSVDVLGHRMLSPKRSVHVLKVLNKVIVVGVTESGMTSLGEINDDESLKEIGDCLANGSNTPNSFSEYVDRYLRTFHRNGKTNGKSGHVSNG